MRLTYEFNTEQTNYFNIKYMLYDIDFIAANQQVVG